MTRKDDKVALIIQATTEEFLKKGFDAASMHNIALIAGVSKRTLYKYFPDKEELFSALIDELLKGVETMYQVRYTPDIPVRQQLENFVDHKIALSASDQYLNMSRIVIGEILKSRFPSDDQMMRMDKSEVQFVTWVEEARKDGQIVSEMDSRAIADQFLALIRGQIFFPSLLGFQDLKTIDTKEIRDRTVEFFLNSFQVPDG